jgi:hypothetical protein
LKDGGGLSFLPLTSSISPSHRIAGPCAWTATGPRLETAVTINAPHNRA